MAGCALLLIGLRSMSMSISEAMQALERQLADIRAELAALKARLDESCPRAPASLANRNGERHAEALRLREAIAGVLATHPAPESLTAKQLRRALEVAHIQVPQSDRTLRWHLAALRGNGNTAALPPQT